MDQSKRHRRLGFVTRLNKRFILTVLFIVLTTFIIIKTKRYMLLFDTAFFDYRFILAGLLIGHVLTPFSIVMTQLSFKKGIEAFSAILATLSNCYKYPLVLIKYSFIGVYEELFWRGTIQYSIGNPLFAIPLTSLFFTIPHFIDRREVSVFELFELFTFSLLLGLCFYWTGSLSLVAAIHAGRNICLTYMKITRLYAINKKIHFPSPSS